MQLTNEVKKNILPEDFDGTFKFTNFTDEDFIAKWNSVEYRFPKNSTTPMIIPDATPVEVQSIRKKFAKELAVNCFYQSDKFKSMNAHTPGGTPALYTDTDLAPFIQRCLEPLPVGKMTATKLPKDEEQKLSKDSKGRNVTRVLEEGDSLIGNGSEVVA